MWWGVLTSCLAVSPYLLGEKLLMSNGRKMLEDENSSARVKGYNK
jgi:hypothetical protein